LAQLRDALERDLAAALQSNPISFSPGEEWIPDDAAYVLRELAQLIVDSGLDAIEVRAHTSSLTDVPLNNDANLVLSQRRADAVRAELVRLGVAPGAISATGVGEAEPIDDNTTQAGRDKNRRVEIRVNDTP
jgi:OOP family OmpA-OmpF porin